MVSDRRNVDEQNEGRRASDRRQNNDRRQDNPLDLKSLSAEMKDRRARRESRQKDRRQRERRIEEKKRLV